MGTAVIGGPSPKTQSEQLASGTKVKNNSEKTNTIKINETLETLVNYRQGQSVHTKQPK